MGTEFPPPQECHNCMRKHRPSVPSKQYKRCSGCHLLTYCDPDCQAEHWTKVHKKHCKVIAGRKALPHTVHGEDCATCLSPKGMISELKLPCMAEETVAKVTKEYLKQFGASEEMSVNLKAPFRFGELSGCYLPSKYDEQLAHMWNILQVIHHLYYDRLFVGENEKAIIDLENHILFLRAKLWRIYTIFGNCKIIESKMSGGDILNGNAINLIKAVNEIFLPSMGSDDDKTRMVGRMTSHIWWTLFINHYEGLNNFEAKHHAATEFTPDCFEGNTYPKLKEVYLKYKDHSQFKIFWPIFFDQMMYGLPVELRIAVPPNASCVVCKERVKAQFAILFTSFPTMLDMFRGAGCPDSFVQGMQFKSGFALITHYLQPDGGRSTFCSVAQNPNCIKFLPTFLMKGKIWRGTGVYEDYVALRSVTKDCDNCLRRSLNCHRCSSCKSFQYCSKECLTEDWEKYHKSVCGEWKKKNDKKLPCSKAQKEKNQQKEEELTEVRAQICAEMVDAHKRGMTCNSRSTKK